VHLESAFSKGFLLDLRQAFGDLLENSYIGSEILNVLKPSFLATAWVLRTGCLLCLDAYARPVQRLQDCRDCNHRVAAEVCGILLETTKLAKKQEARNGIQRVAGGYDQARGGTFTRNQKGSSD